MKTFHAPLWVSALLGSTAAILSTAAAAQTHPQGIAIPAFFTLTQNTTGTPDWVRILNAGAVAKIIVAGFDSLGAGTGSATDCQGSPAQMFDCLRRNGQIVLGYVNTASGSRSATFVLHGGDGDFNVDQWYATYGGHIDGIFFDVGPTENPTAAVVSYYQNLYQSVRTTKPGTCGNGTQACVMLNAAGVGPDFVVDPAAAGGAASDWSTTYEAAIHGPTDDAACGGPYNQDYFGTTAAPLPPATKSLGFCASSPGIDGDPAGNCSAQQSPQQWYFLGFAAKTAHILRQNAQTVGVLSNADLDNVIAKGRRSYGSPGFLYIQDQGCGPHGALYTHLSPYFEHIAAAFGSAVSLTKSGTGTGSVSSNPNELTCGSGCSAFSNHISTGKSLTLSATADAGSTFASFTVNGATCANPCSFTVSGTTSVVATFNVPSATLSVSKAGGGGGTVVSSPAGISCGASCSATYSNGPTVTLTATPDGTSNFGSFSSNCTPVTGTPTQCTILMSTNATVTATFVPKTFPLTVSKAGSGAGTVTSSPAGISCGATCSNVPFTNGSTVTLTAAPDANSNFGSFSSNCTPVTGTPTQCTIRMSAAATVTVTFSAKTFPLTVSKAGSGTGTVASSPTGITCGATCTASFNAGSTVTLTATPDAGNSFTSWTSNCTPVTGTPTQCTIAMSAAATVTATFTGPGYRVTVSKAGTGAGTVTSSPAGISCGSTCTAVFATGTTTTLTAAPDASSNFTGFSSNCTPVAGAPTQCTVSTTATVTATFVPKTFVLTVSKAGTGGGTVTSSPAGVSCGATCSASFTNGSTVTLTAAPDASSNFTSFSSNCTPVTGTPTQCTIAMTANATVTATFTPKTSALTVAKAGSGSGTVISSPAGISCGATCSASFSTGSVVTLTATPDAGSAFTSFSSACVPVSGNPNACTITMNASAQVTAIFTTPEAASLIPPLFSDNFGSTTGLGPNWLVWTGSYTTDGTAAISGTPPIGGNWASVVPPLGTDDYAVSADLVIPPNSLFSGLVARGSANYEFTRDLYAAQISSDGSVNLYRRNAWNWTSLGTAAAGVSTGVRYTLKFLVSGSNPVHLEVWLDGALQIQADDSTASRILSGAPGIENYDSGVRYSSFAVFPAPILDDNFTGTTGLGANWNVVNGTYTTDGSAAISGAPPISGNWAAVVPAPGTDDYIVSSDIVIPPASQFSGVVARGSTAAGQFSGFVYAAQLSTDGSAHLYRRNNWNWTELGNTPLGIVANVRYSLALVVSGTDPVHLEVWVDGTRRIVVDDDSADRLLSGQPGIENYDPGVRYSAFALYQGPMFIDTFNRTTGMGAGWNVTNGSYTTDGAGAVSGAPPISGNWAEVTTPLATADYAIQADIVVPSGSLYSGLVVRSANSSFFTSDLYAGQLSSDGTVNLYRRNGWNWTLLTGVNAGIVAGTRYTAKLLATGSTTVHLELWVNGVLQLSFDDGSASRLTTGAVGIENYDAGVRYSALAVSKQ